MSPRTRIAIPSLQLRVADPSDAAAVSAALQAALGPRLAGSAVPGTLDRTAGEIGEQVAAKARRGGLGR
jgi:hypothetical protein